MDSKYWVLNLFAVAQSITNAGITNASHFNQRPQAHVLTSNRSSIL